MAQVQVPSDCQSGLGVGSLGAFENQLAIIGHPSSLSGVGSQPDGFLKWFDPQTDTVTSLLGGSVNGGPARPCLTEGVSDTRR
jgi:hypothetical protein